MTIASGGRDFRYRLACLAILLTAALPRFYAPDWDGGYALHPDERYLIGVAEATSFGLDRGPCCAAPDFPYGTVPLLILRPLLDLAPAADPLIAARLLAALAGVLLVAASIGWGRALSDRRGGCFAGLLMAIAPFPIQQAHFYTVDPWAALFASVAMLALRRRRWGMGGSLLAIALMSKLSLAWTVPIPLWMAWRTGKRARRHFVLAFGTSALLTNPWLWLHPIACWRGPLIQAGMVAGRYLFPYTRQYLGTRPWLYPLWQMSLWGLGGPAVIAGIIGWGTALWMRRGWPQWAAAWTAMGFLLTGGLFVKFPRYLFPLYPAWTGWATWLPAQQQHAGLRHLVATVILLTAAFGGLAQTGLYTTSHPWITASQWLCESVLPGEPIAIEAWDHPLPLPLPSCTQRSPAQQTFTPQQAADRETVASTALLVIASRRNYAQARWQPAMQAWYAAHLRAGEVHTFTRCPHIGPLAITDDPLLDAGLPVPESLTERCRTRWALRLPRLDESFRVYDAPLVLLTPTVALPPSVAIIDPPR